jgi:hypothetical protein
VKKDGNRGMMNRAHSCQKGISKSSDIRELISQGAGSVIDPCVHVTRGEGERVETDS